MNRRELLILFSNSLIGAITFPLVSCTDKNFLTNPQRMGEDYLSDEKIKLAQENINGYFNYNLSGKRLNPSLRRIEKGNIVLSDSESGYDWVLIVTRYKFLDIIPSTEYFIAKVLFKVQGKISGYNWRPYKPGKSENKELIFKLKIANDGNYTIANPLPPICYPDSMINHLRYIMNININIKMTPAIEKLNITEKTKALIGLMEEMRTGE